MSARPRFNVRLTPTGALRISFDDDDDVIDIGGPLTDHLFDRAGTAIVASIATSELDDYEMETAVRSELADQCRRLDAYLVYRRWRARVSSGMTSSTLVADPTFQVRHSYDSEAGQLVTKLKTRDKTPVAQRPTEAFREFWVQQYVAANFRRLGFDGCEGPFESGPDFRLHKTGRWRAVEVETFATNYLKHKHHLDARWNDAEHLIVLEDDLGDGNPRVPDVMVIDRAHFTSWCSTAMKDYALRRQEERPSFVVETQLHEAGQVFRSLALETCSSKRREMAACPDCNRCPYFGDGDADGGVADRYFFRLTASFLEVARGRVSFAAMIRFFDDHYDWSLTGFEFEP